MANSQKSKLQILMEFVAKGQEVMNKVVQETKEQARAVADQTKKTEILNRTWVKTRATMRAAAVAGKKGIDSMRSATDRLTIATRRAANMGVARLNGLLAKVPALASKAWATIGPFLGAGAIALLPAITAGAAIKTSATFAREMSNVQAVAQATQEQMGMLSEMGKYLGETTEFSATQAAEGMRYLSMAGLAYNQTLQAIKPSLDLALIGNMELGESADIVTNVMGQFGLKAGDITRIVDVMARTASSSNTTVREMGDAFRYIGPLSQALNVSLEETGAVLAVLANNGHKGSNAVAALRTSFATMSTDSNAQKMLKKLKVEAYDAQGGFIGFIPLFEKLRVAMKDMSDKQRLVAIEQIFGSRSFSQINALINAGSKGLQEYKDKLDSSNGSAAEMARIIGDNLIGDWKAFKSAVSGFLLEMGESMDPTIRKMVQTVTGGVRAITAAFRTGQMAEFLSLSLQAGVEQGTAMMQKILGEFFYNGLPDMLIRGGNHAIYGLSELTLQSFLGIIKIVANTYGAVINKLSSSTEWLLTVASNKIASYLAGALNGMASGIEWTINAFIKSVAWVINHLAEGMEKVANGTQAAFIAIFNTIAQKMAAVINPLITAYNKVTFSNVAAITPTQLKAQEVSLGRVSFDEVELKRFEAVQEEVKKAATWAEAWEKATKDNADAFKDGEKWLHEQFDAVKKIVGLEDEHADKQHTKTEQLNKLIAEMAAKRQEMIDKMAAAGAGDEITPGGTPGTGGYLPGGETPGGDGTGNDPKKDLFGMTAFYERMEKFRQLGNVIAETYNSAFSGISAGLQGMMDRTMDLDDAWLHVRKTIAQGVTQAIAKMITSEIMLRMKLFAVKMGILKAETAAKNAEAIGDKARESSTAATSLAAWTPAAMMKSIATYGSAVIVGLALFAGAMAMMGSFEQGGVVHGGRQIIEVNEGGTESVNNARSTAQNLPFIEYGNAGGRIADLVQAQAGSRVGGSAPASRPSIRPRPTPQDPQGRERMIIMLAPDMHTARKIQRNAEIDAAIVSAVRDNRYELGQLS